MRDFDGNNKIRRKNVNQVNKQTPQKKVTTRQPSTKTTRNIRKKKKSRINKKRIVKTLSVLLLIALLIFSIPVSILAYNTLKDAPILTTNIIEENYISSNVVDSEKIPQDLKNAIVAVEDERFYKHKGVDLIALARSTVHNIRYSTTQGGSTIEMQISKNLLTTSDKTIKRKINDIHNAYQMNKIMSKDEILAIYLNNIYLGKSAYGVADGARVYFDKDLSKLNLAECAMLAGITNNPAKYQEFSEAKRRQEIILLKMKELGYIDSEQYSTAVKESISFRSEID